MFIIVHLAPVAHVRMFESCRGHFQNQLEWFRPRHGSPVTGHTSKSGIADLFLILSLPGFWPAGWAVLCGVFPTLKRLEPFKRFKPPLDMYTKKLLKTAKCCAIKTKGL